MMTSSYTPFPASDVTFFMAKKNSTVHMERMSFIHFSGAGDRGCLNPLTVLNSRLQVLSH